MKKHKVHPKKLMLIVNPIAGKSRAKYNLASLASIFYKNNYEPAIYFTSPDCGAEELIEKHAKDFDVVACCGGDGTVSEAIEGIMKLENCPPLGYIPCGTTNDLAKSLDLPKNMKRAANTIANEEPLPLDIGSFGDECHFAYIASFGAFTEVSYETPQKAKNIFGHMAYIFSAFKSMNKIKPYHIKIESEEKNFEDDVIFCSVTNSTSVAGIFKFDKNLVDFNDGLYEVLLIKQPKRLRTVFAIFLSMFNTTYKHDHITLFQTSKLKLTADKNIDWAIDGEHRSSSNTIEITNNHNAISLISKH